MFAPFSSGHDRWEGGSESGNGAAAAHGSSTSAAPANAPSGRNGKADAKGKGKAKPTGDLRRWLTADLPGLSVQSSHSARRTGLPGSEASAAGVVASEAAGPSILSQRSMADGLGGLRGLGEKWRSRQQKDPDEWRDEQTRRAMVAHLLGEDAEDRSPTPQDRRQAGGFSGRGMVRIAPSESSRLLASRRYNGRPRPWWKNLFRPEPDRVDAWMDSWVQRWTVLSILPVLFVWIWCAMPFPEQSDSDKRPKRHKAGVFDFQFCFFLIWYYGVYCAAGLVYITQLFSLYRLNWWPAALGARTSYIVFWLLSLAAGYGLHHFSLDKLPDYRAGWGFFSGGATLKNFVAGILDVPDADSIQWQRKTPWVALAFATMAMPAFVCLAGLRRSGRQTYRHSLTEAQKTFLHNELRSRIPASYKRFLWFMGVIGIALVALLAGQSYASVFLSTLPHTGLDGTAYVAFWTINVNLLLLISLWILEEKVRSRALIFVLKYYYFMVYFIFYRNLFARLRSFDQFALIQLLSSFWICIWYPFSMTPLFHKIVSTFTPEPKSWEEWVENIGLSIYLRNLAQNTTMLAFLGWVSILHFGPNQDMYPFFAFADKEDPYNYQLTMLGSLAIWGSELASSFVARQICLYALDVDVTNLALDEIRSYPDLITSLAWTGVHVLMDMLLFLVVSAAAALGIEQKR